MNVQAYVSHSYYSMDAEISFTYLTLSFPRITHVSYPQASCVPLNSSLLSRIKLISRIMIAIVVIICVYDSVRLKLNKIHKPCTRVYITTTKYQQLFQIHSTVVPVLDIVHVSDLLAPDSTATHNPRSTTTKG